MAANPINPPLPADLPENWQNGQIVAPEGADVGLSAQHGYNYLMQQVNAAQEGVNALGQAVEDLGGEIENLPTDGIMLSGGGGVSVLPVSANWRGVVYGAGKYVMAGTTSEDVQCFAYSSDGINWAEITPSPFTVPVRAMANNGSIFVALSYVTAVGGSNIAYYSTDGLEWTQTTLPSAGLWYDVAYGNGKFIAINKSNNTVAYSTDGILWTQGTTLQPGDWRNLAFGNGRFVVFSVNNDASAYSDDGQTWTPSTIPSGPNWTNIEYGAGKFVLISNDSTNSTAYSTDGISWTANPNSIPDVNCNWTNLEYGNEIFVATASNGDGDGLTPSPYIMYSMDGVNWTAIKLPVSLRCNWITYGADKFVVSAYGNISAFSTDGINWTSHLVDGDGADVTAQVRAALDMDAVDVSIPDATAELLGLPDGTTVNDGLVASVTPNQQVQDLIGGAVTFLNGSMSSSANWQSVTYGNGKFVAVAGSTNIGAYSTDGINWAQMMLPASATWKSVTYGNGMFVAVSGSNVAAYSTDGIEWTQTTLPGSSGWNDVTYGDGKFVAVASGTGTIGAYSANGISWMQMTLPKSAIWNCVTYGNGLFVAMTTHNNSATAYSTNGINWTASNTPFGGYWESITYANGKFIGVCSGFGFIIYSVNGINWSSSYSPLHTPWSCVTYGNGLFVVASSAGKTGIGAYSTDGINWTQCAIPMGSSSSGAQGIAFGDGIFVAVGGTSNNISAYSAPFKPSDAALLALYNRIVALENAI
ncbi:MAG TPA: exo-alpha-sialidase [Candidatus Ventrousia excrementavium]|uniref:Exo-alpha-sialidase n=1 Tax=Candidatus Ventrousia excrementavium TaxID=2840961 RepID=A0A9D1IXE1_9CLOT|nr:exo-alpha-sialidase [Candidatus Ventrousia excrementavium]